MNPLAFISTLCLLITFQGLAAQDLHIYYNAHSKNLTYISQGDTIWRPKVREGAQIFLHVENFNNFLYQLELKTESETIVSASGGMAELLPLGSGGITSLLSGHLNPIQKIAAGGLSNTEDLDFKISGFGADAESLKTLSRLQDRFSNALKEIFKIEKRLDAVSEDVDAYLEGQMVNEIIQAELEQLKRNPRLQPQQIRSLSLEYLQKVFPTDQSEELNLSTLLEKSDAKQQLRGYQEKLVEEEVNYRRNANILRLVATELGALVIEEEMFTSFQNEVKEAAANAQQVEQTITENKIRLASMIAEAQTQNIQDLTALRYEYEAISANDFTETFRLEAEGDLTILNLTFIETTTEEKGTKTIAIAPIKIPVSGGLKLNAGVGISLGGYWEQPQTFFVRDSLISAEDGDSFSPLLTSFIHFYSLSAGKVSLGGSLGIAIPIVGADRQAISFLLGPSLIFGRGERIVISGGLMGGKVEALSAGYQIGDEFPLSTENIPTRSVYQMGYFLGLSFNLGGQSSN